MGIEGTVMLLLPWYRRVIVCLLSYDRSDLVLRVVQLEKLGVTPLPAKTCLMLEVVLAPSYDKRRLYFVVDTFVFRRVLVLDAHVSKQIYSGSSI